jgi:hypothetical protein
LPYCGWYLDCPLDCNPISERLEQEKFDLGFSEKLAYSQGNKKEDIDKRKKKKRKRMLKFQALQGPCKL